MADCPGFTHVGMKFFLESFRRRGSSALADEPWAHSGNEKRPQQSRQQMLAQFFQRPENQIIRRLLADGQKLGHLVVVEAFEKTQLHGLALARGQAVEAAGKAVEQVGFVLPPDEILLGRKRGVSGSFDRIPSQGRIDRGQALLFFNLIENPVFQRFNQVKFDRIRVAEALTLGPDFHENIVHTVPDEVLVGPQTHAVAEECLDMLAVNGGEGGLVTLLEVLPQNPVVGLGLGLRGHSELREAPRREARFGNSDEKIKIFRQKVVKIPTVCARKPSLGKSYGKLPGTYTILTPSGIFPDNSVNSPEWVTIFGPANPPGYIKSKRGEGPLATGAAGSVF